MRPQTTLVIVLMIACTPTTAFAQKPDLAREAINQYLAMDADGRLYNGNWNSYSQMFTWFDAPGWDVQTIIRGYKLISVEEKGTKATAKVVYSVVGRYIIGNGVKTHFETETVTYHLVRSTSRSVVDSTNNLKTATTAERWAVDAPQLEPHHSVRYFCSEVRGWDAEMQKNRPEYPKLIQFCDLYGSSQ